MKRRRAGRLFHVTFLLAPALIVAVWALLAVAPDRRLNEFLLRPYSLTITDRNGVLLQTLSLAEGLRREHVALGAMPSLLVSVFQESEDERF